MRTGNESETVRFTIKNIKDAFWILLEKKRYDKISVRELAHLAGYNRTTFYNYYNDTCDLLQEIENDLLDGVDICLSTIFDSGDIEERMQNALDALAGTRGRLSKMLGENGDPFFEGELKRRIKVILRRFIKQFKAFSPVSEYTLEFYSSGLINIIKMWLSGENEISMKDFESVILNSIRL